MNVALLYCIKLLTQAKLVNEIDGGGVDGVAPSTGSPTIGSMASMNVP